MTIRYDGLGLAWLGYATARIAGEDRTVYTDPGRYGVLTGGWEPWAEGVAHPRIEPYDARDGDVVVVTHDHHYDSEGIRRVASEDATVIVYEAVDADAIDRDVEPVEELPYDTRRIGYGDAVALEGGIEVEAVPGYNRPDGEHRRADGSPLHPEGFGCGYRVTVGDTPVFYPGDSDALDTHHDLDVEVFLPPIGNFTMDRHAAADLAESLDPGVVLPVHYNTFEALAVQPDGDSGAFAADVAAGGIPVALDEGRRNA